MKDERKHAGSDDDQPERRRTGRPPGSKDGQSVLDRIARFTDVDPDTGCRMWRGARSPSGYPTMTISPGQKKRHVHRLAYELLVGPIPAGLTIDHLCHRPTCVNVDHLQVMTRSENTRTAPGTAAKASKDSCDHGHAYDDANTFRAGNGTRKCETCRRRARSWNVLPKDLPDVPATWRSRALEFEHLAVDVLTVIAQDGGASLDLLRRVLGKSLEDARDVVAWLHEIGLVDVEDATVDYVLTERGRALLPRPDWS